MPNIPDAMKDVAARLLNTATGLGGGDGDGAALYSAAYPLNITHEMVEAGANIVRTYHPDSALPSAEEVAHSVYTAMSNAEPVLPDISEDALQTVEVELPDSMFEGLARLIARMHGSAMTYKPPGESMQTVASQHGFGHWGHSADQYAEKHWKKYIQAARAAVEFLHPKDEDAGTEF